MTSQLWKNRRITRSSTLRWNRPEPALAVLLLSIFAPWANAAEPAQSEISRAEQVSAEDDPSHKSDRQTAEERWKELKSRSQGGSAPLWRPGSQNEVRRTTPIRPIPSETSDVPTENTLTVESAKTQTQVKPEIRPAKARPLDVDEPLQISDFEEAPGWIEGKSQGVAEREPRDDEFFSSQDSEEESPAEPKSLESKEPADPGYAPELRERRLRKMTEISPHYDVNIDEDIREFAKEQAKQYNVEFAKGVFPQRSFPGFVYQWEPSNMHHYPLYFEDVPLERYGHTYHPVAQPFVSIAKFSTQLVFLPYQMTLDPVCTPKYVLGYYRPGECAPKLHYQPPLNGAAAAVEAGVVTGLFFAIP